MASRVPTSVISSRELQWAMTVLWKSLTGLDDTRASTCHISAGKAKRMSKARVGSVPSPPMKRNRPSNEMRSTCWYSVVGSSPE